MCIVLHFIGLVWWRLLGYCLPGAWCHESIQDTQRCFSEHYKI